MKWDDALPYIIALGGGTGLGAGLKALADTVLALRAGVSAREGQRRQDIVTQRDQALDALKAERRRANEEAARSDWCELNMQVARANEQRAREHAADLRIRLMQEAGVRRADLPEWPTMEETVPRAKLEELINQSRRE